jgi:hypothetical protein
MDAITAAQHGLLMTLARLGTAEEAIQWTHRHPVLLDREALADLDATIGQASAGDQPAVVAGWELASDLTDRLAAAGQPFVIGGGPIERLYERVESGEISQEHAEALAREADVLASIGPRYVGVMGAATAQLVEKGAWHVAVAWQRFLWIAVNAWPSPRVAAKRSYVGIDFVQMIARLLVDVADGRVYREALAVGNEILEKAERENDAEIIWKVSRRLGILNLDPFVAVRTSADFWAAHTAWLRNVREALGDDYFRIDPEDLAMPEPKDALALAEKHLRRAAELSTDHDRGLNLKALAQTLQWRKFLGDSYERDEFVRICREALRLIDAKREPQAIIYVENMLQIAGEETADPAVTLDRPIEEYLAEHGPGATMEVILHSAALMEDGEEALDLLHRTRAVFTEHGDERSRLNRWLQMIMALRKIAPEAGAVQEKSFSEVLALLRVSVSRRGGDALLATALLDYAASTTDWDGEAYGLEAMEQARMLDPRFADRFADMILYLRTMLHSGAGTTAFNARQMMSAIPHYGAVLAGAVELGLPKTAADTLDRIDDAIMLGGQSPDLLHAALLAVVPSALGVATFGDPVASEMLRQFLHRWFVLFYTGEVSAMHALTAQQLLKGSVFGSLLADRFDAGALGDREGRAEALERIAELSVDSMDDPDTDLTPAADYLLAAFVSDVEQKAGASPGDRLANLRRAFDRRLNAALIQLARGREQPFVLPERLQASLAGNAVFLDYCLAPQPENRLGLYIIGFTRDEVFLEGVTLPDESGQRAIVTGPGGQEMILDSFGLLVSNLRAQVTEDPGFGPLTNDAADLLEASLSVMLGHLVERLERMDASRHVLYVAPHRALHFLPFALLGGRTPLADRWTVVSVPNIRLALRGRRPALRADRAIASIGLGFANDEREGLPPIPGAVAEAKSVAAIFGEEAIVDADATKANVLPAMSGARFVHISTHGAHDVGAPAFQTIYLTPDGASDGRLFAHEILTLDLRHVELLTLSACETALGRVDADDNPRGLPASFFLAGVRSIVGTLWPSSVKSAEVFFSAMYAEIHRGAPVIAAFRAAQVETRRRFPQFRDWGAFHIMSSPTEDAVRAAVG